jgi:hypothetical protein
MKRLLPVLLLAGVLAPAATAQAQGSGLNIHAIFEEGRTSGFRVGEPLDVSYRRDAVRATRVCWKPAPVDRPACSPGFGAPRRAGVQRFVVSLSNGRTVRAQRRIRPAARRLVAADALGPGTAPVPFTATCGAQLFGNGGNGKLLDPLGRVRAGDSVAAYYAAPQGVVQVFQYRTALAGFMSRQCLRRGLR